MAITESNLIRETTISDLDSIRAVKGGVSRNILFGDFVNDVTDSVLENADEGLSSRIVNASIVATIEGPTLTFCNTAGGDILVTLPSAASSIVNGVSILFQYKRITTDGNQVLIQAQAGDTIDGDSELALAGSNYPNATLASDGNNFYIVGA